MGEYKEIKEEIKALVSEGIKMFEALQINDEDSTNLAYFVSHYEIWYSKSFAVMKQLMPDRVNDFVLLYKNENRKEILFSNYTISDALRGISHSQKKYGPRSACTCVFRQINMIQSCLDKFDSKVFDIKNILQADIFDSEIQSAKHLNKMGYIRAAGAICGVVLEKHFFSVCKNREIVMKKKSPTIADYNDVLKDIAYDTIEWRRIQRLGDLRNLCDHHKDRDPSKEEVDELIAGVERVTKTIF